jgi:uncharacterized membrane protein YkoI
MKTRAGFMWTDLVVILAVGALIPVLGVPSFLAARRSYNERAAITSLKTLTTAEADFRSNDRDGNRSMDFWTADVYALHGMIGIAAESTAPPPDERTPGIIKLIEVPLAAADGRTDQALYGNQEFATTFKSGQPKRGYFFRALHNEITGGTATTLLNDTDGAGQFYGDCHDHDRFAFIACPTSLKAGKLIFVVNEDNTIWQYPLPSGYTATFTGSSGAATDSTSTTAGKGLAEELTLTAASGQGTFPGIPRAIGLSPVKDDPAPEWGKLVKGGAIPLSEAIDKGLKEAKGGVVVNVAIEEDDGKTVILLVINLKDGILDLRMDAAEGGILTKTSELENWSNVVRPFKVTMKQAVEAAEKKTSGKAVGARLYAHEKPEIGVTIWLDGKASIVTVDGETGNVTGVKR